MKKFKHLLDVFLEIVAIDMEDQVKARRREAYQDRCINKMWARVNRLRGK